MSDMELAHLRCVPARCVGGRFGCDGAVQRDLRLSDGDIDSISADIEDAYLAVGHLGLRVRRVTRQRWVRVRVR